MNCARSSTAPRAQAGLACAFAVALCAPLGAAIDVSMTDGGFVGAGYPGPLRSQWQAVSARSGSGSGSTGGGLGGTASVSVVIQDDASLVAGGTTLHLTGSAQHLVEAGYTAVMSSTGFVMEPIVLTLAEEAAYTVSNASTAIAVAGGAPTPVVPVRITALTGTIDGDASSGVLSPGTYALDVWIGAFAPDLFTVGDPAEEIRQAGYASFLASGLFQTSADWSLHLAPVVHCLPTDQDCNGVVDTGDVALALLDFGPCPDCPSDVDGSGEVDFGDIALIMLDFG